MPYAKGICQSCGKIVHSWKNPRCRSCFAKSRINRVKVNCLQCGKEFIVWPANLEVGRGKHCSKKCYILSMKGRHFSPKTEIKKGQALESGENHHNWKGGITSENKLLREKFSRTIAKDVLKRDHYRCQMCGTSHELQVDHIQSWSEYVELRFNIDNCRTLCKSCHYFVTFGKRIPDTKMKWGFYGKKEKICL